MTLSESILRRDAARRSMAYCGGIMRNRLDRGQIAYLNEGRMWGWLRELADAGADFEVVKAMSRSATSWTEWSDMAIEYLKELGQK